MKPIRNHSTVLLYLAYLMSTQLHAYEDPRKFNGFDVNGGSIAPVDIYYNTELRDEIPAIDTPNFLQGDDRNGSVAATDRVLAINYNGVAKAYPIKILDMHEIVNDSFNGKPVAVTFCPLCGTGMAFSSMSRGKHVMFGVSGLVYNNNVLLYDRATESLWSQVMMTAVSGPMKGEKLTSLPAYHTTWGSWIRSHPDSLLLSEDTGYPFDYETGMYDDYRRLPMVIYPTVHQDSRIPGRSLVVGIAVGDQALAVPHEYLDGLNGGVSVTVGTSDMRVEWDKQSATARVTDMEGNEIPAISVYWFAWVAFYPSTALYAR
jgi:hypothetical protein